MLELLVLIAFVVGALLCLKIFFALLFWPLRLLFGLGAALLMFVLLPLPLVGLALGLVLLAVLAAVGLPLLVVLGLPVLIVGGLVLGLGLALGGLFLGF